MKFCQLNTAYAVHYVYFTDVATHCYFSKELIQKFRKMFHKVAVAYIQSKKKVKMNDYFKYIIIDHYAIALQYWWMFTNCAEIWFSRVGFFAQVVKYQL